MENIRTETPRPGVLVVYLNRPEKSNSFSLELYNEVGAIFRQADADPNVRCIVLAGEGRVFSAGMGFDTFNILNVEGNMDAARKSLILSQIIEQQQVNISAPENCKKPVIAACHGACYGMAVDLICACDIRFCTQDLKVAVMEVMAGVASDVGSLQRLQKIVGSESWARDLIFTGRTVDAQECLDRGLFSRMFENREAMMAGALDMAEQIASYSPLVVSITKMNILYTRDTNVQAGLEHIKMLNSIAFQTDDLKLGVDALIKKKKAVYPNLQ